MKIEIIVGNVIDEKYNISDNKLVISEMTNTELENMRCLLKAILQYSNFENRYELIEDLSLKSFIEQINEKIIEKRVDNT